MSAPNALRSLSCATTLVLVAFAAAQDGRSIGRVAERIAILREQGADFHTAHLFQAVPASEKIDAIWDQAVRHADVMRLDAAASAELLLQRPERIALDLPGASGTITVDLQQVDLTTDEMVVRVASTGLAVHVPEGLHYQGSVRGDPGSIAAISVHADHVMGLLADDSGTWNLGTVKTGPAGLHVLYRESDLLAARTSGCDTPEDAGGPASHQLPSSRARTVNCVNLYWEVNHDIFLDKGGLVQATDYILGLFNETALLYGNDGIDVALSGVVVWDTPSPYTGTTTGQLLAQFQAYRNSFPGDLGHLLGYAGSGGVAAGFTGLCASDLDESMCYSGIDPYYNNVPTYSWSVSVVAHEQGHLLGSRHTHACVWNGNGTAIDGCGPSVGYPYEGTCGGASLPPAGGTLMSYCHLTGVGMDFLLGFGPQPAALITGNIDAAPCLQSCGGTSCGVPYGLVPSNITTTTAHVEWLAVNGATSYTLDWKEQLAPTWNTVPGLTNTEHDLLGLTPYTAYQCRVRSFCGTDSSTYGITTTFITAAGLDVGVVACYPFNGDATDHSGHAHHGTVFGPVPVADRFGVPGNAYQFDGVNDRIDVTDFNTWGVASEFTIGFWMKTQTSTGNFVAAIWPDQTNDRLSIAPHYNHNGVNSVFWDRGPIGGGGRSLILPYPFVSEWEHFVFTASMTTGSMKIYRNGALIHQEAHAAVVNNVQKTWSFGGNGSQPFFYFDGLLDDAVIWSRELVPAEVEELYTVGAPCAARLLVAPRVLLDGPYDSMQGSMSDDLRSAGLLPDTEPYTGLGYVHTQGGSGVSAGTGVLATTGMDAIVDWLVVELREPIAPYSILASRSALVQRDGDVVGPDGFSPVAFDHPPGNYRVAVRHRNHFGVMTGTSLALGTNATTLDFSSPGTVTHGVDALKAIATVRLLWSGNTVDDGLLRYAGSDNDRDPIVVAIGGSPPTNTVVAYDRSDVNMDGVIKYVGQSNDRDRILQNIGGTNPNAVRFEQLP